jgi:hypothetical protein
VSIYLPIAELPVNLLLILGLGVAVGFISGMFGVGGGFLMTPLLILVGIPPAVAVATVPTHMAASSMSGALTYWRRKLVDFGLGLVLLSGGLIGTAVGVWLFAVLLRAGQLDLIVGLSYVILLGIVGGIMLTESVRAIVRAHQGEPPIVRRPGTHAWFHGLPLKLRFRHPDLEVDAPVPEGEGLVVGHEGKGKREAIKREVSGADRVMGWELADRPCSRGGCRCRSGGRRRGSARPGSRPATAPSRS